VEVNETITTVELDLSEGTLACLRQSGVSKYQFDVLSAEGRQAYEDIMRFCRTKKERKLKLALHEAVRNRQFLSGGDRDLRLEEHHGDCSRCRCGEEFSTGELVHCWGMYYYVCLECIAEIQEDAPVGSVDPTNAEHRTISVLPNSFWRNLITIIWRCVHSSTRY